MLVYFMTDCLSFTPLLCVTRLRWHRHTLSYGCRLYVVRLTVFVSLLYACPSQQCLSDMSLPLHRLSRGLPHTCLGRVCLAQDDLSALHEAAVALKPGVAAQVCAGPDEGDARLLVHLFACPRSGDFEWRPQICVAELGSICPKWRHFGALFDGGDKTCAILPEKKTHKGKKSPTQR